MVILLIFRREQRRIDTEVDEKLRTPADFTVLVTNLPQNLPKVDYHFEIKNIMENYAALNVDSEEEQIQIIVKKIVLVYNIEEIIDFEKKLD
jgi:hypothetical protein